MILDCIPGQVTLTQLAVLLVALVVSTFAFKYSENPQFQSGSSVSFVSNTSPKRRRFLEICEHAVPACRLNPFLFGSGHLHTLWNVVAARRTPYCAFNRTLIEQQDPRYPGTFAMDFVSRDQGRTISYNATARRKLPPNTSMLSQQDKHQLGSKDLRPMLVVLPGLGGGSEEEYVRETCLSIIANNDWEVVIVVSRGCSRTTLTSKLFYHAGSTWDLSQAVAWLKGLFPNRPLYGLGFSLGANILTNYVATKAAQCDLQAVMVISNPWDLEKSLDSLQSSWFGRETYLRSLGTTLKTKVLANATQVSADDKVDISAVREAKYLPDFDLAVQVPMWGFGSVRDYYRTTSSAYRVASIAIPFLAVNALDDPISAGMAIPTAALTKSAYTVLCTTKHGGHVGWHCVNGRRWIARATSSFFDEMLKWRMEEDTNVKL